MPLIPPISAASNFKTTLVRSIIMTNGQPVVNDTPNIPPFYVGIVDSGLPRGFKYGGAASLGSPRHTPPAMLRHATGLTGPSVELGVGDRCNVLSYGLLELLDNGTKISTGVRLVGLEYAAAPINQLYPFSGILSDMDGNPISNMPVSIWGAIENHDVLAGEFEDYEGEAPIEFLPMLMRNVDVMVGTIRYRILAAEPDYGFMNVHLRLRKADEPLAT